MSHTPGPWTERVGWLVAADHTHILYLDEISPGDRALLIAAPDLLAACKAALRMCEHNGYGRGENMVQAVLKAAIAKAETNLDRSEEVK